VDTLPSHEATGEDLWTALKRHNWGKDKNLFRRKGRCCIDSLFTFS